VPILIYLFVLAAIPFHLWAGYAAKITLSYIFSYYTILVASCILFYNSTFLFSLATRRFGSFQPWLGSGAILWYLYTTMMMSDANDSHDLYQVTAWFGLFSPWDITEDLFPHLFNKNRKNIPIQTLQFFSFPVGESLITLIGFYLLSYGLLTSAIWQGIKRCFRNQNTTIWSKGQSYLFVAISQFMLLGMFMQGYDDNGHNPHLSYLRYDDPCLSYLLSNSFIIFSLIPILSPHRQTVQDWARYRHRNTSWLKDLIWGEKSPALLAIFINLLITTTPIFLAILLTIGYKPNILFLSAALTISFFLIYATIAQLILLQKTSKRAIWAYGTIGAVFFVTSMITSFVDSFSRRALMQSLFSPYPFWLFSFYDSTDSDAIEFIKHPETTLLIGLCLRISVFILLTLQLKRQMRILGESATKVLSSPNA